MYPMLIAMGFMTVVISLIVGYFNSQTAAAHFAASKGVRETTLFVERASIGSIGLWLPYVKFLSLGLILGGIVMALRVIIDGLKDAGLEVVSVHPESQRPRVPAAPWYGLLMPMVMMIGELIFVIELVLSLQSATTARSLFSNPIPAIDAARAGAGLLLQLQGIQATTAWLVPLSFFGVATEFLAIVMGLATITLILTQQTKMLDGAIETGKSIGEETPMAESMPGNRSKSKAPSTIA